MTTKDTNRKRIAAHVPPDQAHRTEVDCPECRAPGGATRYYDPRTSPATLVAMECRVCGMYEDDFAAANQSEADLRAAATEHVTNNHEGAGWYRLSDGGKKRGKEKAIEAQMHLLRTADSASTPDDDATS